MHLHNLSKPSEATFKHARCHNCKMKQLQRRNPNWRRRTETPETLTLRLLHAPPPPPRRYRKGTCPSLASCCDLPSWTPLPLLALESLLPLTVFCSGFTRLASVSCTGVSSSGFRCVETNRGGRGTGRKTETELSGTKLDARKKKKKKVNEANHASWHHLPTPKLHNDDQDKSTQRGTWRHTAASRWLPSNRLTQAPRSFRQTHGHTDDRCGTECTVEVCDWLKDAKWRKKKIGSTEGLTFLLTRWEMSVGALEDEVVSGDSTGF